MIRHYSRCKRDRSMLDGEGVHLRRHTRHQADDDTSDANRDSCHAPPSCRRRRECCAYAGRAVDQASGGGGAGGHTSVLAAKRAPAAKSPCKANVVMRYSLMDAPPNRHNNNNNINNINKNPSRNDQYAGSASVLYTPQASSNPGNNNSNNNRIQSVLACVSTGDSDILNAARISGSRGTAVAEEDSDVDVDKILDNLSSIASDSDECRSVSLLDVPLNKGSAAECSPAGAKHNNCLHKAAAVTVAAVHHITSCDKGLNDSRFKRVEEWNRDVYCGKTEAGGVGRSSSNSGGGGCKPTSAVPSGLSSNRNTQSPPSTLSPARNNINCASVNSAVFNNGNREYGGAGCYRAPPAPTLKPTTATTTAAAPTPPAAAAATTPTNNGYCYYNEARSPIASDSTYNNHNNYYRYHNNSGGGGMSTRASRRYDDTPARGATAKRYSSMNEDLYDLYDDYKDPDATLRSLIAKFVGVLVITAVVGTLLLPYLP